MTAEIDKGKKEKDHIQQVRIHSLKQLIQRGKQNIFLFLQFSFQQENHI